MRHPEHARFLEENWLFEAMTETYVPLLLMLSRLEEEGLEFQFALGLTPCLAAMLRDALLQKRYVAYLERTIQLADDDIGRNKAKGDARREGLARFYRDRLREIENAYVNFWKGDVVGAFRHFQDRGFIEIMASAATHGLLPVLLDGADAGATSAPSRLAAKAQIQIGCQYYRECFGRDPRGFWLPECAYTPGLEPLLHEAGVRWFVVEAHGLYHADPMAANGLFKPCRTPSGVAVFGRDPESSRRVWSAEYGFPGGSQYREFYRDLGHELPLAELREYLDGSRIRQFTGLKYHRITGKTEDKKLYDPEAAAKQAREDAARFARERALQLCNVQPHVEGEPVVVCAFDAELFGHWWFEGVAFLESFVRDAVFQRAADGGGFALTSPSAYLERNDWLERIQPSASTWGWRGHLEAWLSEENAWIYPHLHEAAGQLTHLARYAVAGRPTPLQARFLKQMARELLLAQSSDWAFLMKTGTASEYAVKRTRDHLHRFRRLFEQLTGRSIDSRFLAACESRDSLFQEIDWTVYAPPSRTDDRRATTSRP